MLQKQIICLHTCVGVMVLISSDANCFKIVVFPALSKPRKRILSSLLLLGFNFLSRSNRPWNHNLRHFSSRKVTIQAKITLTISKARGSLQYIRSRKLCSNCCKWWVTSRCESLTYHSSGCLCSPKSSSSKSLFSWSDVFSVRENVFEGSPNAWVD